MPLKTIAIAALRLDAGTQARVSEDAATIAEYAAVLASRPSDAVPPWPPPVVFYDGAAFYPADGFHRIAACLRAGRLEVDVEVRRGSRRDALLYACGANATHGLARSSADKRRAVSLVVGDPEWRGQSDRWIAERCAVSHQLVADVRRQLVAATSSAPPLRRTGRDGKDRRAPVRQHGAAPAQTAAPPRDGRDAASGEHEARDREPAGELEAVEGPICGDSTDDGGDDTSEGASMASDGSDTSGGEVPPFNPDRVARGVDRDLERAVDDWPEHESINVLHQTIAKWERRARVLLGREHR